MAEVIIVTSEASKQSELGNSILISDNVNGSRPRSHRKLLDTPSIKCQVDLGSCNTKCCVSNCSTNSLGSVKKSQIAFITFPKDPSRFTEWTRAIERPDLLCYLGKKEATNLLVCSKHFPENMWINSNTRIKRLHKNAVPEVGSDDEINIIAVSSLNEKPHSTKKSGLKIKKVSTLLTESALRDTLAAASIVASSRALLPELSVVDSPNAKGGRKFPSILQRQQKTSSSVANSDSEKKLLTENNQLKSELDKNMDYILNQKAHYEGIVSKEKQKVSDLEGKIKVLETAQRKLWHTYESQLQTQKTVSSSKDVGQKELLSKLKLLQQNNEDVEKQLAEERKTIKYLRTCNKDLQFQVDELSDASSTPTSAIERNFAGEKFKDFLEFYLMKEKHLEGQVDELLIELDQKATPEGQKSRLLDLAAQHLNHLHLSWLKWILNLKQNREEEFEDHIREFSLAIFETSQNAYAICAKALGLPSISSVKKWTSQSALAKGTTNSTINALYEEGEPLPKNDLRISNDNSDKEMDEVCDSKLKRKRNKRDWSLINDLKRLKYGSDNDDEGRVSDEDEEIFFTDSEDEDEEEEEEEEEEDKKYSEAINSSKSAFSKGNVHIPIASASSQDYDFIMEEELEEQSETQTTNDPLGTSMPLLVPDSPMTPNPQAEQRKSDMKISNRKKVISSDATLSSSSKVVFRVIES